MEKSASSADRSILTGAFYRNRENGKKLNRKKIIVRDLKKKKDIRNCLLWVFMRMRNMKVASLQENR